MYLDIYLSTCLPIYLSIYRSIYHMDLPIYLSTYLPVYLSTYLPGYSTRLLHFSKLTTSKTQHFCETSSFCEVDHIKQKAILRDLLFFFKLTTSKTKQFCETSFIFELNNVKNEAILRDFFIFHTWQHQKQSNSATLPSKMESWVQRWQPRTNAFCDFPLQSKVLRLPRKIDARSYEAKCCTCHAKSS